MKFRTLSIVLAATCGLAANAGERSWYGSVGAGANWADVSAVTAATPPCGGLGLGSCGPDTSADASWAAFAAVGLAVSDNLRIEGEVGYRNAGFGDRGDISNTTLMLNALFDIPVTESLSFAVGGGLGIDWIATYLSTDAADNASVFAYQAITEASIELTDRIDLTLTYRYLDASGADDLYAEVAMRGAAPGSTAAVRIDDVSTSTVSVGLRFAL